MEQWKDIPGYEDLYQASNKGRIRSKEGKTTYSKRNGKKIERVWQERIIKPKTEKGRDARVDLWRDKEPTTHLIHRLIGKTFIENSEDKPCINHKDGDPRNNRLENLEWVTYKENQNHAFDNGLANTNVGIELECLKSGAKKWFRSMTRASEYLDKNKGYISAVLIRGKEEADGYKINIKDNRRR